MKKIILLISTMLMALGTFAQDIKLPAPDKVGGMPLMKAIAERKSVREFDTKEVSEQSLSNVLWAAYGFNRPYMRTVPSDRNRQEFEIYVVLEKGVYLYNAAKHALELIDSKDIRALTGKQDFVKSVPVNLVYVYDLDKQPDAEFAYSDCGFIAQNVYLVCTSEGLGSVLRVYFDAAALGQALKLSDRKKIMYSQTIGHIKK